VKRLLKNLLPDEVRPSVHQIDYERLWYDGYRTLIFDIDNTLGAWGCAEIDKTVLCLLSNLTSRGFALGFLSNDKGENRSMVKAQLTAWPLLWNAKKPSRRGYYKIMDLLQSNRSQTAIIGDQLFTDVWGAKRAGLYAIWVAPVNPQTDSRWAKLRRPMERWVISLLTREDTPHENPDQR
jgi:HAD superfamily phosphatase (TIGR01668 family)